MGAVTPVGVGVDNYWRNLVAGACGVKEISRFDASRSPSRLAAEIDDFDPAESLPRQVVKSSSRFMRYAYAAAAEAIENSGLDFSRNPEKIGACVGSALAGAAELTGAGEEFATSASGRVSPHLVPRALANVTAAHLAIQYGFRGPGFTLSTACSAGGDALMVAAMTILAGDADSMIVVGGESILAPVTLSSLSLAKALSRRNENPETSGRPFDLTRDGFVIGEGGGALILEKEQGALARGANILAVLAGWGNSLDGYHVTAPDPNGDGAAQAMFAALKRARMTPDEIDYVNAHGTGTALGDKAETLAIKKVFGARVPPVSSTKGATGHLMGAGGLTELIACVKAIETGLIPPTLNLDNPDPDCDLDYVPKIARRARVNAAMSNSLGFGGQNSSVIVRRYQAKDTSPDD